EAGVAEGLELVVPGRAEGEVESLAHRAGVGELEGRPHAVLRHDDVAVHVGHGVEDAEVGGVRPPGAVGAVARVLGDLVAQVGPPAQGGRQLGARTLRSLPRVLGAVQAAPGGLRGPVHGNAHAKNVPCGPLDVGAQGTRCGVHEQHTPRDDTGHVFLPGSRYVFPYVLTRAVTLWPAAQQCFGPHPARSDGDMRGEPARKLPKESLRTTSSYGTFFPKGAYRHQW